MKKYILLTCFALLIFNINIYALSPINVKFMSKSIEIITPDEEYHRYSDIEKVPDILYSSTIIAYGMAILSFYNLDIVLKNNHGIFISKNPITNEVIISKTENSAKGNISLVFDIETSGEITPDTKLALRYTNSKIILTVLTGCLYIKTCSYEQELQEGEFYTYQVKEVKE